MSTLYLLSVIAGMVSNSLDTSHKELVDTASGWSKEAKLSLVALCIMVMLPLIGVLFNREPIKKTFSRCLFRRNVVSQRDPELPVFNQSKTIQSWEIHDVRAVRLHQQKLYTDQLAQIGRVHVKKPSTRLN